MRQSVSMSEIIKYEITNWYLNVPCADIATGLNTLIAGPRFNIKISSYQYRKSHCGDKTVVRSSYLHNGISYTGKMSSLYWIGALMLFLTKRVRWLGRHLYFVHFSNTRHHVISNLFHKILTKTVSLTGRIGLRLPISLLLLLIPYLSTSFFHRSHMLYPAMTSIAMPMIISNDHSAQSWLFVCVSAAVAESVRCCNEWHLL